MKQIIKKITLATLGVCAGAAHYEAKALQMPWDRGLVLTINLASNGDPKFRDLYNFLETSGSVLVHTNLGLQYRYIKVLNKESATKGRFRSAHTLVAKDAPVRAVDSIVMLHGTDETLHFFDGSQRVSTFASNLRASLTSVADRMKLRMVYNTSCFGMSHNNDFISAGFRAVSGTRAVNTNSGYELPIFLSTWGLSNTYSNSVLMGNNEAIRVGADNEARRKGFTDVDSRRVMAGSVNTIRLTSESSEGR